MGQLGWYYCGLCSTMNWLGDPPLQRAQENASQIWIPPENIK